MAVALRRRQRRKVEWGDFQTPLSLARGIGTLLTAKGVGPAAILEPTCGRGGLLIAALTAFPEAKKAIGVEINPVHVAAARDAVCSALPGRDILILQDDFFSVDWPGILATLPDPLLIVGNPPWVTNAELSGLGSSNVPEKSNFQRRRGIEAVTGKSNFDISEWMLLQLLENVHERHAWLGMLCKTSVARKVLLHGWSKGLKIAGADLFRLDAARHFGATVDACFLLIQCGASAHAADCRIHPSLGNGQPSSVMGFRQDRLLADVTAHEQWKHLHATAECLWRSGIKHDCARVFELRPQGASFRNGFGDVVELEPDYLFPMLKSSDLAGAGEGTPSRWMLVTQQAVGGQTETIRQTAPKTWCYLMRHAALLDGRASTIYRSRPRFSVFGVGPYSFSPWKVAISGLYKTLQFRTVGPHRDKPVVFDDTCSFLPCKTEEQATVVTALLNSETAQAFFSSFVFWDAKRPITIELLRRLDLDKLAAATGISLPASAPLLGRYEKQPSTEIGDPGQGMLF